MQAEALQASDIVFPVADSCSRSARRAQLGDSPDTSKALRSLVAAGLVQREGRGGRSDTFRYKARTCMAFRAEGMLARRVFAADADDSPPHFHLPPG